MEDVVTEHSVLMGKLCSLSEAVLHEGMQTTQDQPGEEVGRLMERANGALQEACDALQALFVGDASPGVAVDQADDPKFFRVFWRTFLPSITAFNLLYGLSRSQDAR